MRIALLSYEYPPETGFGGIGTYTWFQARALAQLGHEVHVLAGAVAPSALRASEHDGVRVWRYRGAGLSARLFAGLGRLGWWWSRERLRNALDMYAAVRAVRRQVRFDVMEMPECGAEGLLVNRFGATPSVVRYHSPARMIMPFYDVRAADVRLCSGLEEFALRGATACTSSSQYLATAMQSQLAAGRAADVIHNGIDLDWFDVAEQVEARRAFGIPDRRPMVLFAGRMERRKGIHLCPAVARAILAAHDVAFVFAGDDLFGYVAQTLVPALQGGTMRGTYHVLGRRSAVEMRSLMRQADVVFLPSLWESCPYSCLEAMAAGRTIVASDAGGMPELLRHRENGLVVPVGDEQGFIGCLTEALEDRSLRERLGNCARKTVETSFQSGQVAVRSLDVYRRAAA